MTESKEKPLATWLMKNIVKGDGSEYLDFEEISSKLTSILPKKKLRQLVKLFSNVERKTGRSRGNWQKVTQRYYGIKWSQTQLPSSTNNEHVLAWTDIPSCLPSGFFIISTTFECITIGHFTGLIVNGNKIMTEIKLLKIIERSYCKWKKISTF